jgi:hypothetical protein
MVRIKDVNNQVIELKNVDNTFVIFGSIDNLDIESTKDFNIEIGNKIWITNSLKYIQYLDLDDIAKDIGVLTKTYLQSSKAFAYKIIEKNEIDVASEITEFIDIINSSFSFFLWLLKDNEVHLREAFFPWLFTSSNSSQNSIYKINQDKTVNFNLDEINYAISLFEKFMSKSEIKYISSNEPPVKKADKADRFSRALYLITHLRTVNDLSLRISNMCSIFELFFSTDNSEITHKLAERTAFILTKDPEKRLSIYNTIKDAYSIRSRISHGDIISSQILYEKILSIAESCDIILRTIVFSYIYISEFSEIINYNDSSKKNKYFEEIIFGLRKSPLYDNEIFDIKFNKE